MSLVVLDTKDKIKIANDKFLDLLMNHATKSISGRINYRINKGSCYFNINHFQNIKILKEFNIWFSYLAKYNRNIYVFGSDEPKLDDNRPFCVITFPNFKKTQDSAFVFAQDKQDNISILYRVEENKFNYKSLELIEAKENGKNKYFSNIGTLNNPNFVPEFLEFLENLRNNDFSIQQQEKICESCGKIIFPVNSNNKILNKLLLKNNNLCESCLEKEAATYIIKKIKEKISWNLFTKNSLLEKVDDPALYESYLEFLVKVGYLKIKGNLFSVNQDFNKEKLKSDNSKMKENNGKDKCIVCGITLSSENSIKAGSEIISDKCKDCSKKAYAVKALNELEEYVDPGISFSKNDLLKQVEDKIRFTDYIWTLEEFDLIEKDSKDNFYILKPKDVLLKFKEKYGDAFTEPEEDTDKESLKKEKKSKKIIKECEICHQKLPVSKFYKTDDGYSDKCKECSRKSYTVKALIEIKKYVTPSVEFYKEDLLKNIENRTQILDYFWILQDFDFIEHNEKNNTYTLKPEKDVNAFIEKFSNTKIVDSTEKNEEGKTKTSKKCSICKKVLPISNFYKSSESADGLTENCKKCTDKLNAANILSEIKQQMGIGTSFNKKDLSRKIDNPNKANYYLWILLENDLIHEESSGSFVIENNEKYREYINLIKKDRIEEELLVEKKDSTVHKIENKDDLILKHIIFVSELSPKNRYRTVVLRGVIDKNKLYALLEDIKEIITSNMTNMNFDRYKEDFIKIILELDIENEKFDETMNYLHSNNWEKF